MPFRNYIFAYVLFSLATYIAPVYAQQYPSKPVKVVVPYSSGGGTDAMARVLANQLSGATGGTFFVENKGGADGTIGADQVAKSLNDGHTLLIVPGVSFVLNQVTFKSLPYSVLDDFEPVSMFARGPMVLLASTSVPAESMSELVALLKAKPGKYSYAGTDPFTYLTTEMILQGTGTSMLHVPYKGATPAAIAAAAGQVEVSYQGLGTVTSLIQGGKLRLLAFSTPERLAQYPDVPTVVQAGISDFFFNSWFAMIAPAGTPKLVIDKLNAEMQKALTDSQTRERLVALGVTIRGTSAAEFRQATEKQYALYGKLIKDNKIQAD
jgi:tripartite-type tricarboxylate transporter receptor subunit TctC